MTRAMTVGDYMTPAPHSIGIDQSLEEAAVRMRKLGVRHLPVLEGGVLRGIVSERDVAIVESLDRSRPASVRVEEAMSIEPYTVSARAPLSRVAKAMADHRYGCAVIMQGAHVSGIFTTTDALRALHDVLSDQGTREESMAPSQVRSVIMAEHTHLRRLLDLAEESAERVLSGGGFGDDAVQAIREQAAHLRTALFAHLELENRVLVPAIREVPAFGPQRADQMLLEHAEQTKMVDGTLMLLDDRNQPAAALAAEVKRLVQGLRRDLDVEEEALLNEFLLRDEMIPDGAEAG